MKDTLRNSTLRKYAIKRLIMIISFIVFLFIIALIRMQAQTVTDIDGNVYNTVTIGTQVWMKENLKTINYNDGITIPNITGNADWIGLTSGAYCWYNNDAETYKATYGALYNWHAVSTVKLCPIGWHVPSFEEWLDLATYLGGESVAGGKLKETGTTHWLSPNTGATNETGFTALPGSLRHHEGGFSYVSQGGVWWSSSESNTFNAWGRGMNYNNSNLDIWSVEKFYGFSVRCVKDLLTYITNPSASIIEIYPNPVSGILNIDYKGENFETVSILNSQGALLTKIKSTTLIQQLDFSKYKSGLYFLEFAKATGEIKRLKVVKR
jgi:uncharacterized protein (TIGR02145 family)